MAINDKAKRDPNTLFSECAQLTLDPYWKQLFEDCARGKFPRGSGISLDKCNVYFRNKGNGDRSYSSYRIPDNPEKAFKDLKQLFQDHLGFRSNKDRQDTRTEIDDMCKELQESFSGDWNKIKRKKVKDPIVRRYILELKDSYILDDEETAQLAQLIKLGFLFNWIGNDQVLYEDQRILDISSLHFDERERIFSLDEPRVNSKREYKPKSMRLSTLWNKYIENPQNRYTL